MLRAWRVAECGIDHYDEGVYALSAEGVAARGGVAGLYEGQHKFSPPFYVGGVALLRALTGLPADRLAILWNVAAGTATVALVWAVGRAWFGAAAGAAAAVLVALSEFHVALSRSGLTDVTFALLHLAAVLALGEALHRRSLKLALAGGALTALAWNTKYHGWLALVSAGLALVPALWAQRRSGLRAWARPIATWLAAAAVAVLGYLPWALYVDSLPGGYGALGAYQRTMLRKEWLENLGRQIQQQKTLFEGGFSRAALPLALLAAMLVHGGRARGLLGPALAAATFALASAQLGLAISTAALAALGLWLLRGRLRDARVASLAAWVILWAALTPLYQPYARLYLPLAVGLALSAGTAIAWIGGRLAVRTGRWTGVVLLTIAAGIAGWSASAPTRPWNSSRGMAAAASSMSAAIAPGERVFVLGDPSTAFYLEQLGHPAREHVEAKDLPARLEASTEPAWVVCGIYPSRTGAERHLLDVLGSRLRPAGTFPLQVKDLRVLDDHRPAAARAFLERPTEEYALRLYRWLPK